MMIVTALFWLGMVLTVFMICCPLAMNWDRTLDGHCGSTFGEEIGAAVVNMTIDGVVALLPVPVLWQLKLPVYKKLTVGCMFGLGLM
jgi:hypothetical protein